MGEDGTGFPVSAVFEVKEAFEATASKAGIGLPRGGSTWPYMVIADSMNWFGSWIHQPFQVGRNGNKGIMIRRSMAENDNAGMVAANWSWIKALDTFPKRGFFLPAWMGVLWSSGVWRDLFWNLQANHFQASPLQVANKSKAKVQLGTVSRKCSGLLDLWRGIFLAINYETSFKGKLWR